MSLVLKFNLFSQRKMCIKRTTVHISRFLLKIHVRPRQYCNAKVVDDAHPKRQSI